MELKKLLVSRSFSRISDNNVTSQVNEDLLHLSEDYNFPIKGKDPQGRKWRLKINKLSNDINRYSVLTPINPVFKGKNRVD